MRVTFHYHKFVFATKNFAKINRFIYIAKADSVQVVQLNT